MPNTRISRRTMLRGLGTAMALPMLDAMTPAREVFGAVGSAAGRALGAPPVRMAIAREWVQPRWRLEMTTEDGTVRVDFDETGRARLDSK